MTIGAAYIRVSTQEQVEYSPEAQRKAIVDYAEKHDVYIPEEYMFIDDGYSGKSAEKRPAFMKMIRLAKGRPRPFEQIIVHRFDRFARNREDSVIYKSLLKKEYNIPVISVTEQLEDDKFSIILESMLEAMAEYYSLNLSDEVKKGMLEKASRGGFQTRPPLGYEIKEKGILEVVHAEADAIQYMYDKFIQQRWSPGRIAKELNALGYKTKNNKDFDTRAIERILSNPIYMGYVRWNCTSNNKGKLVKNLESEWIIEKGQHEAIIDEKCWEKAQVILQNRKNKLGTKQWASTEQCKHWLRGILKCAYCGGAMVYGENKKAHYRYYRCNNKIKGKCDKSNYVSINKLEEAILKKIEEDFYNLEFRIKKITAQGKHDQRDILSRQLNQINSKLERAKEAFLLKIDTPEEYKTNKLKLLIEQQNVINNLKKLQHCSINNKVTPTKKYSINSYLTTPNISIENKNKAIKSIIDKIIIDGPNKCININYYLDRSL